MNEFIDAYSDDQIFLELLDELIESHPRERTTPDTIRYSACCRLWSTMMIGSIEMMIKQWGTKTPPWPTIRRYLDGGDNRAKVEQLRVALSLAGLPITEDVFEDLLAIKYIRNAYVHARWVPAQRAFVVARGFPETMMGFDKTHFERMLNAYRRIMNALGILHATGSMRS